MNPTKTQKTNVRLPKPARNKNQRVKILQRQEQEI